MVKCYGLPATKRNKPGIFDFLQWHDCLTLPFAGSKKPETIMKISIINLVIIRWRHRNLYFILQRHILERLCKINRIYISLIQCTHNLIENRKQPIRIV